jgi:thiol-disulfide isomerase/thioredoxin
VKIAVGKTFNELVVNNDKDVFVSFSSEWCGPCKQLEPVFEKLAIKLANNPNIVLVKIDAQSNETPDFPVNNYPQLKFFLKGRKVDPIDYQMPRNFDNMLMFLKQHTTYPWVNPSFRSQAVPARNDEPAQIVVRNTYEGMVLNTGRDVLIIFYDSTRPEHQKSLSVFKLAAEKFNNNPGYLFATYDIYQNEMPLGLHLERFPTVLLLLRGRKHDPIEFVGNNKIVREYINFLKNHGTVSWIEPKKIGEKNVQYDPNALIRKISTDTYNQFAFEDSKDSVIIFVGNGKIANYLFL